MWFPMQVGSNETRYAWMDEGFTQFNTAQAMRVLYGEPRRVSGGRAYDTEIGQRASYLRAARAGAGHAPDDCGRRLSGRALLRDELQQDGAGPGGAARRCWGPQPSTGAFVEYGRRWVGRHPAPYDFFNAIAAAANRDLSWFWTTWFYQGWPLDQAIDSVTPAGDSVADCDRRSRPGPDAGPPRRHARRRQRAARSSSPSRCG